VPVPGLEFVPFAREHLDDPEGSRFSSTSTPAGA
jgi:hypothetical protein